MRRWHKRQVGAATVGVRYGTMGRRSRFRLQAIAEQSGVTSAQLQGLLNCSGEANPTNLQISHFSVFWYYSKATAANEQLIKAGALRAAQLRDTEERLEAVTTRSRTVEVAATEASVAAQVVRVIETRLATEVLTTTSKVIAEAQQEAAKAIAKAQQEAAKAQQEAAKAQQEAAKAQQEAAEAQRQVLRMVEESTGHVGQCLNASQASILHVVFYYILDSPVGAQEPPQEAGTSGGNTVRALLLRVCRAAPHPYLMQVSAIKRHLLLLCNWCNTLRAQRGDAQSAVLQLQQERAGLYQALSSARHQADVLAVSQHNAMQVLVAAHNQVQRRGT